MKILYLDINIQYHNPTRNNIPLLLRKIANLDIYGAGYQSKKILEDGIKKFYEKNGPYDLVVTNEHIVFGVHKLIEKYDLVRKAYKKNYYFQFDLNLIKNSLIEMDNFFKTINSKKIVFLLESDYYNFEKRQIEKLRDLNTYVVGLGKQFYSNLGELTYLKYESFANKTNENWYDFICKHDNKIISLYHFVNSSEFYFESIDNRKNLVYIPGVNYYLRKRALESIKKSKKYSIDDKKIYNKVYSLLSKIGLSPYSNPVLMRLYNQLFKDQIETTKYIYTCGSGLSWPLRKFFEIPALGSLLLATSFKNAKDMGFIDGENYIECNCENIIEKLDFLENNPQKAYLIAKKGQDLVWNRHSLDARAEQLQKCFNSILNNNFNGTYWNEGEFYVK